jgi:hypothetical protein
MPVAEVEMLHGPGLYRVRSVLSVLSVLIRSVVLLFPISLVFLCVLLWLKVLVSNFGDFGNPHGPRLSVLICGKGLTLAFPIMSFLDRRKDSADSKIAVQSHSLPFRSAFIRVDSAVSFCF